MKLRKNPKELHFDQPLLTDIEQAAMQWQIDIVQKFITDFIYNVRDLKLEYVKTVDENFWDLI